MVVRRPPFAFWVTIASLRAIGVGQIFPSHTKISQALSAAQTPVVGSIPPVSVRVTGTTPSGAAIDLESLIGSHERSLIPLDGLPMGCPFFITP